MKKYAVILAGGSGLRAGGEVPKQFQIINGLPLLWWSVKAFFSEDEATKIRIVMHPGFFDLWDILFDELTEEEKKIPFEIICGGRSRLESVSNGILGIPNEEDSFIAVHDAARPLVTIDMIRKGWGTAYENKTAIPVVPMIDSIRETIGNDESKSVDRSKYVRVQTPQVFDAKLLKNAYESHQSEVLTDDASVVEAFGRKVALYPGDETNIKVTNPLDFKIAELLLLQR